VSADPSSVRRPEPPDPDRPEGAPAAPGPVFAVLHGAHVPHAAAPTMTFTLGVSEPEQREVYTIALTVQIHIDPALRPYSAEERARLVEMFGEAGRWAATTHSFLWARTDVLVPSFRGAATFEVPVPCTYDLEVAASKYMDALEDGSVPLSFHFSGTVFYRGDDGRLQLTQIPWSASERWRMPVGAWRAMIAHHYPHGGWVSVHADTLARLQRVKASRGLPTFDACIDDLIDAAGADPPGEPA